MKRFGYVALALLTLAPAAMAQSTQYRARLSVMPLDIAMQATMAGSGSATATVKGTTLVVNGTFSGLKSAVTTVRIHRGPKMAMRGPSIGDLTATAGTSGTISGSIELSKVQLEDLAAGRLYLQLHSEKAPEGNLWGWFLPQEAKK
jgi:hypothetical protein